MNTFDLLWEQYSKTHLVCDINHPLICNAGVSDEAKLYNIPVHKLKEMYASFESITETPINDITDSTQLSGGQKVVLMILLAIFSPAEKIIIHNPNFSLDATRRGALTELIEKQRNMGRDIIIRSLP